MNAQLIPNTTKKIAVIDDDRLFTDVVSMALSQRGGFEVLTINEPQNALAELKQFAPDLILLDVIMPQMDGAHLHFLMDQDPELMNIPVIILSGLIQKHSAGRDVTASPDARRVLRLGKPMHPEALVAAVEVELGRNRMEEEEIGNEGVSYSTSLEPPFRRSTRPGDSADPF